jgi:hypothetical protein
VSFPLYAHQEEGIAAILKRTDPERGRVAPGALLVAFDMRMGKTRTVIVAACELFRRGELDQVIVVCPNAVRGVWFDPELGQIAEYSDVPVLVTEYRAKERSWTSSRHDGAPMLRWVVTNYEFMRSQERRRALIKAARSARTMLVVDESSAVSSPSAQQTMAVWQVRKHCDRALLLNGTPEGDNPGDMYAQFKILDPAIVGCQTWGEYKATYAKVEKVKIWVKDPRTGKPREREVEQIVSWHNLEDLGRRTAPYVLRRLASEVHDMPVALPPVPVTVTLGAETWKVYKELREDSQAWLGDNLRCSPAQAAVKVLRLSQVLSGFLGGVVDETDPGVNRVKWLGEERQRAVVAWVGERLREDPKFKVVLWCRFRAEAERLERALSEMMETRLLIGGLNEAQRNSALQLLDSRTAGAGAAALVATVRTGGMGLDMAAAATLAHVSHDYSRMARTQADARILGPKQTRPVSYNDFVAEGPRGERTMDHVVLRALKNKRDLAALTASEWLRELSH